MSSLEDAGLRDRLSDINEIYGNRLDAIGEYYKSLTGRSRVFSDADAAITEALITFDTSRVANKVALYTDDLSRTLMNQIVTGEQPTVGELVSQFGEATAANIQTELNTAVAGFSRSITQKKAKDLGFDLFIYLGPDDDVTRPFCEARVNKIWDTQQIATWDNGTNLPAAQYGGGYNCRHDLRPLSEERAKQLIESGQAERG